MDLDQDEEGGNNWLWIALVLLVCGAVGIYYYWSRLNPPQSPAALADQSGQNAAPAAPIAGIAQGDAALRQKAIEISTSTKLAEWLQNDDIIRRLSAAAAIVAEGNSPRESLAFLKPGAEFSPKKRKGKLYVDPKSYRRYDALGAAFDSLNADGSVRLFAELKPLFQAAYGELGESHRDFSELMTGAIVELLKTPLVYEDIRLKQKVLSYKMSDPKLEKLSAAQKHLLRMGPENSAKIQGKLRQIAIGLGVAEDRLPKPETYSPKIK